MLTFEKHSASYREYSFGSRNYSLTADSIAELLLCLRYEDDEEIVRCVGAPERASEDRQSNLSATRDENRQKAHEFDREAHHTSSIENSRKAHMFGTHRRSKADETTRVRP